MPVVPLGPYAGMVAYSKMQKCFELNAGWWMKHQGITMFHPLDSMMSAQNIMVILIKVAALIRGLTDWFIYSIALF